MDEYGRNFTIWPHFTWKYWFETRRIDPDDFMLTRHAAHAAASSVG